MANFNDIKVGDPVLITLGTGGWSRTSFLVKANVTKVTPKQFVVDGQRYWKKNGRIAVASSYSSVLPYDESRDQTKERDEYLKWERITSKVNNYFSNRRFSARQFREDLGDELLVTLYDKIIRL